MKLFILLFILFCTSLFSSNLDYLLKEYDTNSKKSLQTVDEKLGHVFIYSQKDIELMQYHKLNDILKELPLFNLNKNRYGFLTPSLSATKAMVSGFFRVFINDHEVSSIYNQSAAFVWGDLPLDFIDHLEIYYGESSFSYGSETGIYFIRLYTKKGIKENGNEINLNSSSTGTFSESLTNSKAFENGWSHLVYFSNEKTNDETKYKNHKLKNNADRRYLYLNVNNEKTDINMAYTDITKDNYLGLSNDANPDDGELVAKDFFIDFTKYFLNDNSLKTNISVDVADLKNEELNQEGLSTIFYQNLKEADSDSNLTKIKANITKSYEYGNNNFLTGISVSNKKYEPQSIKTVSLTNQINYKEEFSDFDEEQITSLIFEDDYKIMDNLILIGNAKFDKYKRSGSLENISEELYRVGAIYTPFENFGIKTFYTNTYLAPSFYNMDYSLSNKLDVQKYELYTIEGVYTTEKQKFRVTHHNVLIDDFIYFHPTYGFMNIDHGTKAEGFIYSYEYLVSQSDKLSVNYFTTRLSEDMNNSNKGVNFKYMGEYDDFEYFTSLVFRNSYTYLNVDIDDSYDFSLGASYNIDKNLKISLKGENLLDNASQSVFKDSGNSFVLDDYERSATLSLKWIF
jgi:vitamin B12 transporter